MTVHDYQVFLSIRDALVILLSKYRVDAPSRKFIIL
jgi:hypothetical protein